ncbi:hypothetical protein ACWA16_01385 [Bacillus subtilis]|uniref:hypothetical protein n=1 Tax=Bacillus subtilis TaxID=1423 RepID=UPI0015603280|nr:hypothetical protein [Bacillus subtilis]NRF01682.1 hypothetical protein [Bacillus subtilis]NRG38247.1 hypothetical protein [Bacillus subtilis]
MLLFIGKFILLYIFCSFAYYLFKVAYYNIGKKLALSTSEGTKANWVANVFIKNGTKLTDGDYFMVAIVSALWLLLR